MYLLEETSTGIEITASTVRFVQLRKRFGRIDVSAFGEKKIPVESIEYSSSKDKVILETVRSLFDEQKVKVRDAAVGIPRSSVFFRNITMPPVKDDVIVPMVDNMAERHLPIRPSQAVYDFDYYDPDRKGMRDVVLFGVKRDDIMDSVNMLKKVAIRVVAVEPTTLSSCRLLDDTFVEGEGQFIHVHFGQDDTHVNIFRNGRLVSTRSLDITSRKEKGDVDALVEQLKRELILSTRSLDLIPGEDQIMGTVVLTSDQDISEHIKGSLEAHLQTSVVVSAYPEWLPKEAPLDIARYGICIGLAAGRLRKSPVAINLLPLEMKKKRRKDEITKTWILAGVNVVLLVLLLGVLSLKRDRELAVIEQQIEDLESQVTTAERVRREYFDVIKDQESVLEIRSEKMDWLRLLDDISEILPEDAWLTRMELEKGKPVLLAGMASSAAKLIPILEDSPMLEDVRFEAPTTKTTVDGEEVENFRITATFKQQEIVDSETGEAR